MAGRGVKFDSLVRVVGVLGGENRFCGARRGLKWVKNVSICDDLFQFMLDLCEK